MIDILMATYNGEEFIEQQIESIINQTKQDWTLYIHDDGSSDNTVTIIKKYVSDRVILIEDGICFRNSTRNFIHLAVKYAQSEYFCFSDQDDIWDQDKLDITYKAMLIMEEQYGKDIPLCVSTDLILIDEKNAIINNSYYNFTKRLNNSQFNDLLIENNITGCTMLMNRQVLEYLRILSDQQIEKIIQHDWLIGLICSSDGKINQLNEKTVLYRQHGNNATKTSKHSLIQSIFKMSFKNRYKNILKLKEMIKEQNTVIYDIIHNKETLYIMEQIMNTKGLKYKAQLIRYKMIRSKTFSKTVIKLLFF